MTETVTTTLMHLTIFCPPGGEGGGNTWDFRQKTIPDRREFANNIVYGARELEIGRRLHPGAFDVANRLSGVD